jgi:opacity protein-like surface antigen
MKKLLLAAAATAAFSSAAIADNEFYLRADAGINMFNKAKVAGLKLKAQTTPSMELGLGYSVMDNVRAELAYGYHFSKNRKASTTTDSVKVKGGIQTLMVKGFYDAFDLGMAQVFVGAGVGLAKLSENVDFSTTNSTLKKKSTQNTFTYLLALGTSFDVADSVKIDVQYNFQDFGKTNSVKSTLVTGYEFGKVAYRSHAIKAGVRFAL